MSEPYKFHESIRESEYGRSVNNFHITRHIDVLNVTLTYPNIGSKGVVQFIEVDQESVRASDALRLHYDYDRDGWVVLQASRFAWPVDDKVQDSDWQEVAFIQSGAREETDEEQNIRIEGGSLQL